MSQRMIWVELLSNGRTFWKQIPWGKKALDEARKLGLIINYHE